MFIANSQISMAASHEYQESHEVTEQLGVDVGSVITTNITQTTSPLSKATPPLDISRWRDEVNLSIEGSLLAMHRNREELDLSIPLDSRSRVNLMILQQLYESITGQSMNLLEPQELKPSENKPATSKPMTAKTTTGKPTLEVETAVANTTVQRRVSGAIVYNRHERYQEKEQLQFQAEGVIRTKDGREIAFTAQLGMSREYVEESNLTIRNEPINKIDPLVINFDGHGAELSQTRFAFDLDNNGTSEQIASLRSGSGFLALDSNGDGTINNGSELFGPQTGKGFAELAAYDEDGNQFIDEGDSIYHQLRIWSINEDGSTQLAALGDKQIGAIFLGHITTPFQLKDSANNSLGEVANSSIYISEDGQVGTVQEIHLVV